MLKIWIKLFILVMTVAIYPMKNYSAASEQYVQNSFGLPTEHILMFFLLVDCGLWRWIISYLEIVSQLHGSG